MRFVSDRASAMIDRVLAAKTNDFLQLTLAAGLSPGSDFHHTLMRGVDFAECDLDTFDFSGTVFDSCGFEGTRITGSRFDGAVFHNCSLEDAADYALWAAHQTPRRGTARDDRTPSRSGSTAVPVAEPVDTSERGAAASGKNQRQMEAWQVRCLCELTNFAGISRKLGTHAASRVMLDLSRTIGDAMPMRHRVAASQSMIDIKFACSTPDAAKANLESMCASLPRKVSINGERCKLNLRLGAATLPSEEEADERLRETAERALDRAEEGGPVVLIDLSRELPFDPLDLLVDLPRAMAKDELRLLYQPKMHVGRQQVVGVEALMRWMHPSAARYLRWILFRSSKRPARSLI